MRLQKNKLPSSLIANGNWLTVSTWLLLSLSLMASPLAAAPLINFSAPSDVLVGQLSTGSEAVIFAVCKEPHDWTSRLVFHLASVADDDGDGWITYAANGPLTARAVWAAADLATGDVAITNPTSNPPLTLAVDPTTMLSKAGQLEDVRQGLRLLVLRPGTGAWHGSATDGGAGDVGPANDGKVLINLAALTPVPTTTGSWSLPPSSLAVGDLVVGIDTTTLETYQFTVPALSR